jgi:hypothetical protein
MGVDAPAQQSRDKDGRNNEDSPRRAGRLRAHLALRFIRGFRRAGTSLLRVILARLVGVVPKIGGILTHAISPLREALS